jgi:hypothetical protein
VAIAPEGSGQNRTFWFVAEHYGLSSDDLVALPMSEQAADFAMIMGQVDAIFRVRAPGNAAIRRLVQDHPTRLVPIDQSQALALSRPSLAPGVVPTGTYRGFPPLPVEELHTPVLERVLLARMDLDETTLADVFKAAGYATGAFGKWHNGMQYPYHPNGRGFDEFYGFCSGHWGHYFDPMLEHNGKVVKGEGFCTDDFTDKAMAFMEKHKDRPFLVYLPYNTPHSPMQVPDPYWDRFKEKEIELRHPRKKVDNHLRCALAMCENIDWNVGRVLKKLDQLGLADNTMVIYFNDNGPNGFRWLDGLRGKKGSTDEGGVRTPLHIRYPAGIKPGTTIDTIASAPDLLPTLAGLAGIPCKTRKPLDGKSLVPLLRGAAEPWPDRILVNSWRGQFSARSQRYRLDRGGRLYDMLEDRGQKRDLAKQHPEITKRLQQAVADYRRHVVSELPTKDARPFIVGHPGARYTHLPARDAGATGGIRRSNRHPNCSFYTTWARLSDKIFWDVMVPAAGTFKVTIYYTCPRAAIGSTVVLRSGDRELPFTIREAHDPPLVGMKEDRFRRGESYVKDFKPLEVGTMDLPQGKGRLELQATRIPGKQVMDVRLLVLERLRPE